LNILSRETDFRSAEIGFIVWLALWLPVPFAARVPGLIDRLFLLAPVAIMPLGMRLQLLPRAVTMAQPVCAALVVVSFLSRTGTRAGLLVVPWLILGGACGVIGLFRLWRSGVRRMDEMCLHAALISWPVGCLWLVISRLGMNPLGFNDDIVLLTAVHFHYAGFAALTMLGMTGRFAAGMLYRVTAWGAITGIPSLALGITFSASLECAAALLLALSLVSAAGITALVVLPRVANRTARAMLAVSAASLLAAMLFAGSYALGKYNGRDWLDIPEMAAMHGVINALGFSLCGLVGWNLVGPRSFGWTRGAGTTVHEE
jgi:YndJ-like protein